VTGYDDETVRICHSCQSARNYFAAQDELSKEKGVA
jgi:hypothetical protein